VQHGWVETCLSTQYQRIVLSDVWRSSRVLPIDVRPHISGSHKTFKVSDALLFKSNLSSDPVLTQFAGGGVVLRSPRAANL